MSFTYDPIGAVAGETFPDGTRDCTSTDGQRTGYEQDLTGTTYDISATGDATPPAACRT